MNIFFSADQFLTLVKSIYLGNEIVARHSDENMKSDYFNLESYIFSHVNNFDLKEEIKVNGKGSIEFSKKQQNEIVGLMDNYIDSIFITRLFTLLAQRDLREKYTAEELRAMSDKEGTAAMKQMVDKYFIEFNDNQFKNLRIVIDKEE
ncbi:MAG: hypothetical protein JW969_13700 [Spirochaetales bacterium]|nr:hypothetical protein [Spirochaetales bacterium]